MKKFTVILLIALLCLSIFCGCNANDVSISNGGFEEFDTESQSPTNWQFAYTSENASTSLAVSDAENKEGSDQYIEELGKMQLMVKVLSTDGYAYAYQTIKVKSDKVYKLEGYMFLTSNITSSKSKFIGARIGFVEDNTFLSIHETSSTSWKKYTVYFRSKELKTLTLCAGIGAEGYESKGGTAYFDNISVTLADTSAMTEEEIASVVDIKDSSKLGNSTTKSNWNLILIFLSVVLLLFICYVLIKFTLKFNDKTIDVFENNKIKKFFLSDAMILCYLLLTAFIVRILTSAFYIGNIAEINSLSKLASKLAENGPLYFYYKDAFEFGNISPLYAYVLWAIGGIAKATGLEYGSIGISVLLKLPSILFDLATVSLIYRLALRFKNKYAAASFALIYALLPTFIFNSTVWGGMESITAYFLALTLVFILDKKYLGIVCSSLLGMLFDARFILVIPVVLFYLVFIMIKNKKQRALIPIYLVISLIVFYLANLPFSYYAIVDEQKYLYVYKIYESLINANKLFVKDAFNIYAMFAQNNVNFSVFANILTYIIACLILIIIGVNYYKTRDRLNILLITSFMYIFLAVFGVRMTPAFILIGLLPLFIYVVITSNKKMFFIFSSFACMNFLNVSELLNISGYLSNNANASLISFPRLNAILITFSAFMVLLTVFYTFAVFELLFNKKHEKIQPMKEGLVQFGYTLALEFAEIFKIDSTKISAAKENNLKKKLQVKSKQSFNPFKWISDKIGSIKENSKNKSSVSSGNSTENANIGEASGHAAVNGESAPNCETVEKVNSEKTDNDNTESANTEKIVETKSKTDSAATEVNKNGDNDTVSTDIADAESTNDRVPNSDD